MSCPETLFLLIGDLWPLAKTDISITVIWFAPENYLAYICNWEHALGSIQAKYMNCRTLTQENTKCVYSETLAFSYLLELTELVTTDQVNEVLWSLCAYMIGCMFIHICICLGAHSLHVRSPNKNMFRFLLCSLTKLRV